MSLDVREGLLGERATNPIVFLEITADDTVMGRLVIELRSDLCPTTCENFRLLCTGETGYNKDGITMMHYKGSPFQRIIKGKLCQSGDIKHHDGTWSQSCFAFNEEHLFDDENFTLRHTGPGVLSMCNRGPNSNGSGFYISFVECNWMNDKNVVFGCICNRESMEVLFQIENLGSFSGIPKKNVFISDCGQLFP
jgi:cyclophilin family peptidyl-prolyl cis-trans isomerase